MKTKCSSTRRGFGLRLTILGLVAAVATSASAQMNTQQQRTRQPQQAQGQTAAPMAAGATRNMQNVQMNTTSIALPSGERESSMLLLEREAPEQVMVGQANNYTIRVTNISESILGQVTVAESLGQGMQIASSQPQIDSQNQQQRQAQQTTQTQDAAPQVVQWQLGMLAPQESKTIQVRAVVSQVGTVSSCLTASYNPALCASTEVVKPNIEMSAQLEAAAEGSLTVCDQPTIRYRVQNVGSGVAENVQIIHPLPEGLTSTDGQTTIVLPVGDLPAGEAKDATAQVKPAQPGEYQTRAYAQSSTDDAYSSPIQLMIGRPALDVQLVGPRQVNLGDPVQYNVTVRNTGDAASENTTLQLETEGIDPQDRSLEIGRIEPGKAAAVSVTVQQTGPENVQLAVRTSSACAEDAMASATTAIRTLPALRLEVIDRTDPVDVGQNTVYAISVKNQGNAAATNVALNATLPQQLQFVEGSGTTPVNAQGNKITFQPVTSIEAGDVASWYVTVKGASAGDARLELQMSSDYLQKPVVEQEPTRVQ